MSLDVWLEAKNPLAGAPGQAIFIREDGQTKRISFDEWRRRFPGRTPVTVETDDAARVFADNITHNLAPMATAAGLYEPLWRPDEIGVTRAEQLIEPLRKGLAALRAAPVWFSHHFNPPNEWGNYDGLVRFVEGYLLACRAHPSAIVRVSR